MLPITRSLGTALAVAGAAVVVGLLALPRLAAAEPETLVLPAASDVAVESLSTMAGSAGAERPPVAAPTDAGTIDPNLAGESGALGTAPADSTELTVHVVGAVAEPGVVHLRAPARAVDAVEAAGGLLPDADPLRVNLARPLTDGEQVAVPRDGEPLPTPPLGSAAGTLPTAGSADPADDGLVDLNRADAATLETLPGIGPVLAERIVQWRDDVGPFGSVDELTSVSGIGEHVLEGLRDRVTV